MNVQLQIFCFSLLSVVLPHIALPCVTLELGLKY